MFYWLYYSGKIVFTFNFFFKNQTYRFIFFTRFAFMDIKLSFKNISHLLFYVDSESRDAPRSAGGCRADSLPVVFTRKALIVSDALILVSFDFVSDLFFVVCFQRCLFRTHKYLKRYFILYKYIARWFSVRHIF